MLVSYFIFSFLIVVANEPLDFDDSERLYLENRAPFSSDSGSKFIKPNSCEIGVNEKQLLDLHNQMRRNGARCDRKRKRPMAKLKYSCQLASASMAHSSDMWRNDFLSHIGSDRSNNITRAERIGYQWHQLGENIAYGFENPKDVLMAWMDSKDHCENIMNKAYTEMGAARVGNYWTVTLGRP